MRKLRQSTFEPVFGSLNQYYGLRKIAVLAKSCAHKVMLMPRNCFQPQKVSENSRKKAFLCFLEDINITIQRYLLGPFANLIYQRQNS